MKNWLTEMRERQLVLAEKISAKISNNLFNNKYSKDIRVDFNDIINDWGKIKKELVRAKVKIPSSLNSKRKVIQAIKKEKSLFTPEIQMMIDRLSMYVAEKILSCEPQESKKYGLICLNDLMELPEEAKNLLKENSGLPEEVVSDVLGLFINEYRELPNVGKLTTENGKVFLAPDLEGLKKIKRLFDVEKT